MEILITFFGAMVNRFFSSKKTTYLISGNKWKAIIATILSTIIYVGIIKEDWFLATIFAFGNGLGMVIALFLIGKEKFMPRTYEVTPINRDLAIEYADLMQSNGLQVTTYEAWFNRAKTLEVKVRVTSKEEKEIAKKYIPDKSLVTGEPIKFSAIWDN